MNLNYLAIYGIALLTHSSLISDSKDIIELRKVEKCLKFLMDPIIDSLESTNNIDCIKNLIKRVKLSKNALEPNNENINVVSKNLNLGFKPLVLKIFYVKFFLFIFQKMWTIAEIADKIMKYSSSQSRNDDTFESVELPEKYFQKQSNDFINNKIYLPREFMNNVYQVNISSNVS